MSPDFPLFPSWGELLQSDAIHLINNEVPTCTHTAATHKLFDDLFSMIHKLSSSGNESWCCCQSQAEERPGRKHCTMEWSNNKPQINLMCKHAMAEYKMSNSQIPNHEMVKIFKYWLSCRQMSKIKLSQKINKKYPIVDWALISFKLEQICQPYIYCLHHHDQLNIKVCNLRWSTRPCACSVKPKPGILVSYR